VKASLGKQTAGRPAALEKGKKTQNYGIQGKSGLLRAHRKQRKDGFRARDFGGDWGLLGPKKQGHWDREPNAP